MRCEKLASKKGLNVRIVIQSRSFDLENIIVVNAVNTLARHLQMPLNVNGVHSRMKK